MLATSPLILALLLTPRPAPPTVWIIDHDQSYDTANGPLLLDRLEIRPGGHLRVRGPEPFELTVVEEIRIEGILSLDGRDNGGVVTKNTANQPEIGALGGPGGGRGGLGSPHTDQSSKSGGRGYRWAAGRGGESSYSALGSEARRAAGGGGGSLAAAQLLHPDPRHPDNQGLISLRGWPGAPNGTGAISQTDRAMGGAAGSTVFHDGDPTNDFWGTRVAPPITGELLGPVAGSGGGGGGDGVDSATFPNVPFTASGDDRGSGGGGGGGLGLIRTRSLVLAGEGRIRLQGGAGGGGENVTWFDRIGGGAGGGSGGMLVLQAKGFDLRLAQPDAITALGGLGGPGKNDQLQVEGAGGQGGPGLIQLHTPDGTEAAIQLPAGIALEQLTSPDAIVLLPILL